MTFTLTFARWWIPTAITVLGLLWVFFIYDDGSRGYLSGLGNLFMLIPVLAVSIVLWIIVATLK